MPSSSQSPALFDLTGRGDIALTGKDRAELLHGLVTNDVKSLRPGTGCHAAFLTPKGKMLADLVVLARADELVIDCEPELASKVAELVKKYIFYQDVAVHDRTASAAVLHLAGEEAPAILAGLGVGTLPDVEHAHLDGTLAGTPVFTVRESRTGAPGYDLRVERSRAETVVQALAGAGVRVAPLSELETARILAGIPKWGRELDESVLPNEALLEGDAISYAKGCYIGQEIVARIRTYGHVNRNLVRIELPSGAEAKPGAEVFAPGESRVGVLTSVAHRVEPPALVALGYVKRDHSAPGTTVDVATVAGPVSGSIVSLRPGS